VSYTTNNTTPSETTSNVVSLSDRRKQRTELSAATAPSPSSIEITLIQKVNQLSIELVDARRELASVTNTLNKLLRLLKAKS
jgi:hypothetical protein